MRSEITDNSTIETHNPLSTMQPGEKYIFELRRHPVGMMGTFISAGVLMLIVAGLAFIAAPILYKSNRSEILEIGALVFLIFAVLTMAFVYIANKVYWGNYWILSDDSLTQVLQTSLFDKHSSQLSLGNLEDVTVEEDGILSHMFKYGSLRIETAGERSKFVFTHCPNPRHYAQQILFAREAFEQGRKSDDRQRLYRSEGSYAQTSEPSTVSEPTANQVDSNARPPDEAASS